MYKEFDFLEFEIFYKLLLGNFVYMLQCDYDFFIKYFNKKLMKIDCM